MVSLDLLERQNLGSPFSVSLFLLLPFVTTLCFIERDKVSCTHITLKLIHVAKNGLELLTYWRYVLSATPKWNIGMS